MNYGIANREGKLSKQQAFEVLRTAQNHGINHFDTSPAYGESESLLGEFLAGNTIGNVPPIITTKLPPKNPEAEARGFVAWHIESSLKALRRSFVDFYLLHDSKAVYDQKLLGAFQLCKETGQAREIGASVYMVEEAEAAIENGLKVLQVPVNVFDHRFIQPTFLEKCRNREVHLIGRSIFLQGLLFLDPGRVPPGLKLANSHLSELSFICQKENITIAGLALNFVYGIPEIEGMVIGVEAASQLSTNVKALTEVDLSPGTREKIVERFRNVPDCVVDPRLWEG